MSEAKGKRVLFTLERRTTVINEVLRGLFEPKTRALKKEMEEKAQKIERRRHPEFFALYDDKNIRPFLAYGQSNGFRYESTSPGSSQYLRAPKLRMPNRSRRQNAGALLEMAWEVDGYQYSDRAGAILEIVNPSNTNGNGISLTANERRSVEALERKARELQRAYGDVQSMLMTAVGACKSVAEFYENYPDLAKHCRVPAYEPVPIATTTALALNPADIMKSIRKLVPPEKHAHQESEAVVAQEVACV